MPMMRLTGSGFDLFKIMRINSQRLVRMVTMPMTDVYRRMRRYLNPNGFSSKVISDVRKGFRKAIGAKESSLSDYMAFPRYYVAKKLLFIGALLLIILPILYIQFLHPIVRSRFLTATMYVNAPEMGGYTGKVKLLSPTSNKPIYQGPLENGRVSGQGVLWDQEERLIYRGGFLMEMYDGEGELFYLDGMTQYKGAFVKNHYEGAGYHYYPDDGALLYEGGFAKGFYEGQGRKYYANGVLQYEGDFSRDNYHGFGRLYDPAGRLIYSGSFIDGRQDGQGVLYENGAVLYEGQFAAGKFNGAGKIYSGDMTYYDGFFKDNQFEGAGKVYDPVTKNLLYDGEFVGGKYCGAGKLFDPQSGSLLYDGAFYNGAYEGMGRLYDKGTGSLLYEGSFRMGRFDGQGARYDPDTGLKIYEGGFLLDNFNGRGTLYDPLTGMVEADGIWRAGVLVMDMDIASGLGADDDMDGAFPDWPWEWDLEAGFPDDGETAEPDGTDGAGAGSGAAAAGGAENGALLYSGPKAGQGIDFMALARLGAEAAKAAFAQEGVSWALDAGQSLVFEDLAEKIGLTLQFNSAGVLIGVDVWNDASVFGASAGMTPEEIERIWRKPEKTGEEALGEPRMVSVSQSNRFHNRITNISADSGVTVLEYKAEDGGTLQAVFIDGVDECLLIEVRK